MKNILLALVLFQVQTTNEKLVKNLGSDDYTIRENATKQLRERIDFKLYAEFKNSKETDPETKDRLENIVRGYKDRFAISLGDYPDYPWICWKFPTHYTWNGMSKDHIIQTYKEKAWEAGAVSDNHPNYSDWRMATRIWMHERLETAFHETAKIAKSEKEFRCTMACHIAVMQEDIDKMIEGNDLWWGSKWSNPLRQKKH